MSAAAMSVHETIQSVFVEVAREQDRVMAPPNDATRLLDMALDSLAMAVIIARLEDRLGIDPFSASDEIASPDTFGEFVALYAHALPA